MDGNNPQAQVREINGQLVLDDPLGVAVAKAVGKHNCRATFEAQIGRVHHFVKRVGELNRSAADVVIVLINVDDVHGRVLADALMPGHDWQQYRDRGEVPFARGLAERKGILAALSAFDVEAATKLRELTTLAVVVVDHGTAEVFSA